MKLAIIKSADKATGKEAYAAFPVKGVSEEADKFASSYVGIVSGSVREFESEDAAAKFLEGKSGATILKWKGGATLAEATIDDIKAGFGSGAPAASDPAKVKELVAAALEKARLARGVVEDISRCKYGVSIGELSASAAVLLDDAIAALKDAGGVAK